MPLNNSIEKYKESSIHENPNGYDLNFRFLEQTTEVVSDKHLKTLFETGDRPNGVDFELLINSKVHQDDFNSAGVEVQEAIQNLSDDIYTAIDNLDEELSFDLASHTSNEEIHVTDVEKIDISKIPSLETAISNINSLVGGVSRQHIVMSIDEMNELVDLIHADICHVVNTKETYMYDSNSKTWIKVSDFDALASVDWSIIQNMPAEFNPAYHMHTIDDVENLRGLIESAVGGDLSDYVKKAGDKLTGNLATESGVHFVAGQDGSDLWSGFHSKRFIEEKQLEARYGVGGAEGVAFAQVGLHDISNGDLMVNRVLLSKDVFRPQYNSTTDLGNPNFKWRDFYASNVISSNLKQFPSTNKNTMVFNNGNVLAFSRCNSSGSWLDDFMTMTYDNKTVAIPNELQVGTLKIGGRNLTISTTAPANPSVGDVWISI